MPDLHNLDESYNSELIASIEKQKRLEEEQKDDLDEGFDELDLIAAQIVQNRTNK